MTLILAGEIVQGSTQCDINVKLPGAEEHVVKGANRAVMLLLTIRT